MNRDDLPLVAFTLLVQLALGAVALAALVSLRIAGTGDPTPLVLHQLYVAGALLILAMTISLFHLGTPAGALRSLRNLRTSWLSREVLLTALFTGLTLGAALLERLDFRSADLLWLATLTGLAAVFTMARLYQATVRPAWTTAYTPLSFFGAVLTLGVAMGGPVLIFALQDGALPPAAADLLLRDVVLTGLVAVAADLVTSAVYAGTIGERRGALAVRLLLGTGGMALLGVGWHLLHPGLVIAGALLLAAAAVLGRIRFFLAK